MVPLRRPRGDAARRLREDQGPLEGRDHLRRARTSPRRKSRTCSSAIPAVMMAAVVAQPDPKWGETPCAFIELKEGASGDRGGDHRLLPRAHGALQGAQDGGLRPAAQDLHRARSRNSCCASARRARAPSNDHDARRIGAVPGPARLPPDAVHGVGRSATIRASSSACTASRAAGAISTTWPSAWRTPTASSAPTSPGAGAATGWRDKADYGYPLYCADMATLLASLRAETVDWVGTSMGGILGMLLASAAAARRCGKLVLNDVGCVIPKAALERIGDLRGPRARRSTRSRRWRRRCASVSPFGKLTAAQWRHLALHVARRDEDGRWRFRYDPGIALPFRAGCARRRGPARVLEGGARPGARGPRRSSRTCSLPQTSPRCSRAPAPRASSSPAPATRRC